MSKEVYNTTLQVLRTQIVREIVKLTHSATSPLYVVDSHSHIFFVSSSGHTLLTRRALVASKCSRRAGRIPDDWMASYLLQLGPIKHHTKRSARSRHHHPQCMVPAPLLYAASSEIPGICSTSLPGSTQLVTRSSAHTKPFGALEVHVNGTQAGLRITNPSDCTTRILHLPGARCRWRCHSAATGAGTIAIVWYSTRAISC